MYRRVCPSDIEQQEGRILRQGNLNPKVKIFRYVTEGTFDSYSWQLIENKQKFIGQIMTSKSPVRSCEDVDEAALTYAEVKALATGNPYIKEKMDLDIQVSKLKLMKGNHTSQKYRLEDDILKRYPQQIATLKERISGMEADIQTAKANLPADKEQFFMKVGDKAYTDKKEAGAALVEMCKETKTVNVPATVGEYAGFKMAVSFDSFNHKFVMNLKGQLSHNLEIGSDPLGNIARINHALESMPKQLAEAQTKLETVERQLETAKVEVTKPFAQEAELAEKLERLSALNALLNMDEKGDDALGMDDAPEEENEGQETSGHDVQKPEAGQTEQKTYPAFYGHTLSYAAEHGEVDRYMESHKFDRECKEAVEGTIRQNFDGMHLKHDIVKPLAEKYGAERMAFILANTLQQESWDGRFSRDNKAWASEFYIPENIVHGIDMNRELIVGSHPAVLDGFIGMFRREVLELEKEMSAGQEKAASGQDAQKPETGRQETEQTQAEAERPEPQAEQTGPGRLAKTPELEDLDEGDEIIDLGDEKDKVLAEMKQSLGGRQETSGHDVNQSAKQNDLKPEQTEPEEPVETELAFQIADRYISIQETEGGYDYSIMGLDYKEIDGGVYDNPGIGIKEAINEIVEDLKIIPFDNGARGNIRDGDKLIPIDYDGLMEKAEAANAVMPQRDVVAAFKAKTNELFHEISEMNPAEIEETVKCHVQAQLDESGIDAVIVDAAVAGSRCRGLEQEGSDLDVVVELSTNEREDALFDMLNESGLHIGGVKVDINPITAQRTGSLETYLPQVEDYLEGVREARERDLAASISREENQKETKESLFPEQAEPEAMQTEPEVTLTVAECSEFHNLGEFYENIPTVEEAVAIWRQIPPERMHGIPAIGVNIHTPGTEAFEDVGIDILTGKRIDLDILEYIPDIKGNPQAMEVIAELVAKLPEMEIDGRMSEEFEAKVWEKRMPDLTPAEQLAVELDRFTYDYDTALYRDSSQSMTENVSEIAEALKQRDTHDIALWLADIAADGTVPEERKRAMELLEKLAEYKPLAKIEEMEEQNYNMVDNVLNNGAGEKAQKEENKKAQEKPAAKPSLKARLAEKKAQAAGQGHEENIKNKQREM